jgi:HEPN domain-containing protein
MGKRGGIMTKDSTLIYRALSDIIVIRRTYVGVIDDFTYDCIGYHLQQFVEKTLKQYLINNGIKYQYNHDLGRLYSQIVDSGVLFNEEFYSILSDLTDWEAKSRYGSAPVTTKYLLEKYKNIALKYIKELLGVDFIELSDKIMNKPAISVSREKLEKWISDSYNIIPEAKRYIYGDNELRISVNFYRNTKGLSFDLNKEDAERYLISVLENEGE